MVKVWKRNRSEMCGLGLKFENFNLQKKRGLNPHFEFEFESSVYKIRIALEFRKMYFSSIEDLNSYLSLNAPNLFI